jgi:O-antigen ligase
MRQFVMKGALGLVGLMWVLPFLSPYHLLPLPSFYGEWLAALLGLAAISSLLLKDVWQPFRLPRIALLPLGLVGLMLVQLALGQIVFPQQALLGMLYLLWAMLLMVVGYRLRQALGWELFASVLAWAVVIGGLLSAVIAVLQLCGVHGDWLVPRRMVQPYGNLGQPNHFADYIALALASTIYLWIRQRCSKPAGLLLVCVFLTVLALSGSRSSWLYLWAIAALAGVFSWRTGAKTFWWACLLLLPVFAVLQSVLPWLLTSSTNAVLMPDQRLFHDVSGVGMRWQIWQEAWAMFVGSPWLGVGFGQLDWNSFLMVDYMGKHAIEPVEHAHNLFLQLLAEMGIFAGVLAVVSILGWFVRVFKQPWTPELWWMLALISVLGIHSQLEYPLWYTYFLGIAAILLGAGEVSLIPLQLQRVGRPALLAMLILGSVGLVNLGQAYASLEKWMQLGLQGQVRDQDLPKMTGELLRIHRESLLSPYVDLVLAASIEATPNHLDEKLQLSTLAQQFSPIRVVVYRHVILLALKGERQAALVQLQRAMRAYPQDIPQFTRELNAMMKRNPGVFDFLMNAVAEQAKEQVNEVHNG